LVIISFLYHHLLFFFFNHTAPTEIYTLSLHDALPISPGGRQRQQRALARAWRGFGPNRQYDSGGTYFRYRGEYPEDPFVKIGARSEEHTSELQSRGHLVCRLLLEKKKKKEKKTYTMQY